MICTYKNATAPPSSWGRVAGCHGFDAPLRYPYNPKTLEPVARDRRRRGGPSLRRPDPAGEPCPMRPTYQVTELLGDGIGPELSLAIHTLAAALPLDLEFLPVDFSLENRRA